VNALLRRYDIEHLARLTPDHRRAALRVIGQLQGWANDEGVGRVDDNALGRFLAAQLEHGRNPRTIAKHRSIVLAYLQWAYRAEAIDAATLMAFRAVRTPAGGPREPRPHPHTARELRALGRTLDNKWPLLPNDQATKWLQRVENGRSPHASVRVHAIGLQLRCVVALALHLGLRPGEVFRLSVDDLHFDNVGVVVRGSSERQVPFVSAAHFAAEQWLKCRSHLAGHDRPWLNLHSSRTRSEPMTRHTFDRLLATYLGPGWTLKTLRDSAACAWARSGLRPEHLRELLGLRSIHDAHAYYRPASRALRREMERLTGAFLSQVEPGRYTDHTPKEPMDTHTRGFCPACSESYWRGLPRRLPR
jgi:integrase